MSCIKQILLPRERGRRCCLGTPSCAATSPGYGTGVHPRVSTEAPHQREPNGCCAQANPSQGHHSPERHRRKSFFSSFWWEGGVTAGEMEPFIPVLKLQTWGCFRRAQEPGLFLRFEREGSIIQTGIPSPPQADSPKPAHRPLGGHSEFRGGEIAIDPSKKWIEAIRKDLLAGGAEWTHSDSTSRELSERWTNALLPWTRKAHPASGIAVYPGQLLQGSTPCWFVPSPEPPVFLQQLRICRGRSSARRHLGRPQRAS